MTVETLILILQQMKPADRVVIPTRKMGYIGSRPCEDVVNVCSGFDWDSGRVFLETEKLTRFETTEKESL